MESDDRDTISRVLEAALASLRNEASGNALSGVAGVTSIQLPATGVQLSGAPVVILIHPNSNESANVSTAAATQPEEMKPCGCNHDESPPHPVFERFSLGDTESHDPSRMCFIEPDRTCVGSGACKTRGY